MTLDTALQRKVAAANNDFGLRLLAALSASPDQDNLFISPLSISGALAMVYNGAHGFAREAIAKTFGWSDLKLEELNAAFAFLLQSTGQIDPQIELAIANSIWATLGIRLAPDYARRMLESYGGRVTNLDLADPSAAGVINDWVSEKTRHKIKELVTHPLIVQAILVLVNALYFKGLWQHPFKEEHTKERRFTCLDGSRSQVPMMSRSGSFEYFENEILQAVRLPYGAGQVCMDILLPRAEIPFSEFQAQVNTKNWNRWGYSFGDGEGTLQLPRFKVEYGAELVPPLAKLGMAPALIPGADFSGMGAGELRISNIIHKTFVEVNEEGTEAAAATAVIMLRSVSRKVHFKMIVDRPFFCAIVDRRSDLAWFMGYIVKI